MIILRHKTYSTPLTRFSKGLVKVGNKISVGFNNAGMAAGERIGLYPKRLGPTRYTRFQHAPNTQLNREAISLRNNAIKAKNSAINGVENAKENVRKTINNPKEAIQQAKQKGLEAAAKTKTSLEHAAIDPGETVNHGIELAARNPITAITQGVGKAVLLTGDPVLMSLPLGGAGTTAEITLKRMNPRYKAITEKLANDYNHSKFSKGVREVVNGAFESSKLMLG